jgi:MFS transporter, UMF1 family
MNKRGIAAWCFYDWANSAFPTVITTFVFAAYFTRAIAPDIVTGTALWGTAASVAGLLVAIGGPILGAIADQSGRRKPWLAVFTALCVLPCALLWFAAPSPDWILPALLLVGLATVAEEYSQVMYNAMLKSLVPDSHVGRVSGWGWGIGYVGGLACLVVALVGFVQNPFWPTDAAQNVRATTLLVAVWFAVFSLPLFLFTPDLPATGVSARQAVARGLAHLWSGLKYAAATPPLWRFLLARMLYADGLATLFAFGGIYAAGTFGLSFEQILMFGIVLNVTAGAGALAFAWIDDWIGAKPTILISLVGLVGLGIALLLISDVTAFWVVGAALGLFVGPAQAASRSLMVHLSPPHMAGELFGLFAVSGRITAFLGPLLFAVFTDAFDSQRAGMSVVVLLLAAGAVLLLSVRTPHRSAGANTEIG